MTLARACELLQVEADFGEFYDANPARLILSEVMRERGQVTVDQLIAEVDLQ